MPIGIYDYGEYYREDEIESFLQKFEEIAEADSHGTQTIADAEVPGLIAQW
jgi:hypothetical protein